MGMTGDLVDFILEEKEEETMATPRTSRKTRAATALQPVRQTLRRLEHEGAKLVARARQDFARYLTTSQRRALENLLAEARRAGGDVERRMMRRRRELETRVEKAIASMERRATRALASTMKRLSLVTHADLRRIEERLSRLEASREQPELASPGPQTPPS
jgi:hypothetical protein